jgi:hypothetical protein
MSKVRVQLKEIRHGSTEPPIQNRPLISEEIAAELFMP